MVVSGFSICRNVIKYDYPVVEAIKSALPLVDEFVINVGQSDDGTRDLLSSLGSDKIKIIDSIWDDSMRKDGLLLAHETNIALSGCRGDWALYLQADEVIHEKDYDRIKAAMHDHLQDASVLGFTFRYLHFYGDYRTLNPWAYHRAVRIVRNNGHVLSCGDAVGFCLKETGGYLQSEYKDRLRPSGATIYHYGWVKQGRVLLDKFRYQVPLYHGDNPPPEQARLLKQDAYDFPEYGIMKGFSGDHPRVMTERVSRSAPLRKRLTRWLNPLFYRAVIQKGFRG